MDFKNLNNLLESAIYLQKKQRNRTVFIVVLLALVGSALFYGSNFFTAKEVTEKIQRDSSTTNPVYQNVVKKQKEDVSLIIDNYFSARRNKLVDEVSNFYADTTFSFFYSYPNKNQTVALVLTKKEVVRIDKIDFNKPEIRAFDLTEIISIAPITDSSSNSENADLVVFVKGKQFSYKEKQRKYESIIEIKLRAKDKKIYSIRSYVDQLREM